MTHAATFAPAAPAGHGTPGDRSEVAVARRLGVRPKTALHYMHGQASAFRLVEQIVLALREDGRLAQAQKKCAGILRALGDAPDVRLSATLIVQEASACGDLEAARAAYQAAPSKHTADALERAVRTHMRTEGELEGAVVRAYA